MGVPRSLAAAAALLLGAGPALAHVMSMSSGELRVEGREASFEIRLPLYEAADLDDPARTLFDAFRLRLDGGELAPASSACREAGADLVCTARYELPAEPDALDIECRLPQATVANHVHVLRAVRGETAVQAVFDYTATRREIRFRPPTAGETFRAEAGAGAKRVLAGPAQLLFLVALAVAARSRRELWALAAAFLAAQGLTAWAAGWQGWQPPPRFVESAGALTIAYLAVETLALPEAGARWLVAAGMGVFHGLYFALFLSQAEMAAARVLSGAAAAEAALLALFGAAALRLKKDFGERPFTRVVAGLLLAVGLGWFAYRMLA